MVKGINKKTVFVGMSGGVDSSFSALLLKQQGYKVVGVFIRTWTPDFIECTWKNERRDAMRICAQLNIPFLECDAEEVYKKNVADYMISEYKKGRTPNPDVMCNREVKFGIFWNFAKKHGADFIATGHYAICENSNSFREATGVGAPKRAKRVERDKELQEKLFELKQGVDSAKDQSYFLWTLNQKDLSHILFPVGDLTKEEVRKIAKKNNLFTSEKKDSQGICFLGQIDLKEFLSHYIKTKKGDVLSENGNVIGFHDGAIFFTIGERHGFTITQKTSNDGRYYVISKNLKKNTITVSNNPLLASTLTKKESKDRGLSVGIINTNWISQIPELNKIYKAQIRYHGEYLDCTVDITGEKKAIIVFKKNVLIASGQSIVVYDGEVCLGGGIVG